MKLLKEILYKAGITEVSGSTDLEIKTISFDSRQKGQDILFIAVRGTNTDGHNFIDNAIGNGAVAIVCENIPSNANRNITYIKVSDSAYALGVIASNFFNNPSCELKLVGVTGTNGKTTTVTLLHDLFLSFGYGSGLISTIKNKINGSEIKSTHTTPDPLQLNALLRKMVDEGCGYCFMEVSSHSVTQQRIAGLEFAGGIFTNITHDHIDYHKTFEEYLKAKKTFFDSLPSNAFALSNTDDKNGMYVLQNTKALKRTYSLNNTADFKARIIENIISGLHLNIDGYDIWFNLVGKFNAYNLLAAYGAAVLLNGEKTNILANLSILKSVEGRFDYIKTPDNIMAIVDYAHTPDALKNVLNTISEIRTGNEKLITVFGCGGDRDRTKRPVMTKIACDMSDKIIITSDNPRSEDPESIIEEMKKGIEPVHYKKVLSITKREEAIKTACSLAAPGDIILIAGKGHEKYQEIKGQKFPFDDKEIIKNILLNKNIC